MVHSFERCLDYFFNDWHTVYVKMSAGDTIKIGIPLPYTTESIKQEISNEEGIPPLRQQLTFNGRVLEDGHKLMEYSVQYGSTLDLVVKPGSKYNCCMLLWNVL